MIDEGLRLAARTARHQAAICRAQGHVVEGNTLEFFAATLLGMADAWPDEAPTDPDPEVEVVTAD